MAEDKPQSDQKSSIIQPSTAAVQTCDIEIGGKGMGGEAVDPDTLLRRALTKGSDPPADSVLLLDEGESTSAPIQSQPSAVVRDFFATGDEQDFQCVCRCCQGYTAEERRRRVRCCTPARALGDHIR